MDRFQSNIVCIALGIICLAPSASLACTCANTWGDSEDAVIEAICAVDVVFVGKADDPEIAANDSRRSKVVPITVFKGDLTSAVAAESSTTCDHWYSEGDHYLIFGMIEKGTSKLSTSICGPTRFTRRLEFSDSQLSIVEQYADRIDTICDEPESTERRLRMLKERRDLTDIEYDQLLEETKLLQEDGG